VLFDFLGWGSSDKPSGYPYTTFGEDIHAMIALVDRALALNPSYARGWHCWRVGLVQTGWGMKQLTLATAVFDRYAKTTRRAAFLAEIGYMTYKVHLDGHNLVPYLTGQAEKSPREWFLTAMTTSSSSHWGTTIGRSCSRNNESPAQ
jgi:hypothetical protein